MPKLRDTRFDPFASPDVRGMHPNAFRTSADPSKGGQERYEARLSHYDVDDDDGPSPRVAVGPVTGPSTPRFARPLGSAPSQSSGGGFGWWLLGAGALALGAYAVLRKSPTPNPGVPALDVDGTSTTFVPAGAPQSPVQVVVNVGAAHAPAATAAHAANLPPVTVDGAVPVAAAPLALPPASVAPVIVEEAPAPPKRRRRRRTTTQGKDELGKFLPAGTAKPHKE